MSCVIPSPRDVRDYLEGYCLDTTDVSTFTVSFTTGDETIALGAPVAALKADMAVSGVGIPTGTVIVSVDYDNNEITISNQVTSDQTDATLTITYNTVLTDSWIIRRRDRKVIPWIQQRTSLNITGERIIEEFISGNGLTTLILSHRPILELVELNYVDSPADYYQNLTQSVAVDTQQGILISKWDVYNASDRTVFQRGIKNVHVKYKVGYADLAAEAPDVCEAITMWLAAEALTLIGTRTGGGNMTMPGSTRTFGDRGKYSEMIKRLEQDTKAILGNYFNLTGAP